LADTPRGVYPREARGVTVVFLDSWPFCYTDRRLLDACSGNPVWRNAPSTGCRENPLKGGCKLGQIARAPIVIPIILSN
jgi:hypothetical protein